MGQNQRDDEKLLRILITKVNEGDKILRLNERKCKDFCCIHNSYTFILYNMYYKPTFICGFRKAKVNRHEHVFKNGIIYTKYSAIVNIMKVNILEMDLARES